MEEKRRFVRIEDSLVVDYRVIYPPDGGGGSISKNISEDGICLSASHTLQKSVVIELGIRVPGYSTFIEATAEVVWVKRQNDEKFPYLVGLRFIQIDPHDRDALFSYLRGKKENDNPLS